MAAALILLVLAVGIFVIVGKKNAESKSQSNTASAKTHCPNCGASLPPGARECGWCGECW